MKYSNAPINPNVVDDFVDYFNSMSLPQLMNHRASSSVVPRAASYQSTNQTEVVGVSNSHREVAPGTARIPMAVEATLPSKSDKSSLTVDGVQFHRSDMKGIYLRNVPSGSPNSSSRNINSSTNNEVDKTKQYVDFQIILNEEEFRELERRKQAQIRQERTNNGAAAQR